MYDNWPLYKTIKVGGIPLRAEINGVLLSKSEQETDQHLYWLVFNDAEEIVYVGTCREHCEAWVHRLFTKNPIGETWLWDHITIKPPTLVPSPTALIRHPGFARIQDIAGQFRNDRRLRTMNEWDLLEI